MKLYLKNFKKGRNNLAIIFVSCLFSYSVFYYFKLDFLLFLPGLGLLLYFPGKLLTESLPKINFNSREIGKFSLAVIYSFCLSSALGLFVQKQISFNSNFQVWAIVLLNLLLFITYLAVRLFFQTKRNKIDKKSLFEVKDLIPLGSIFAVLAIFLLMNHLAQNLDNYLGLLKQSIIDNTIYSNPDQLVSSSRQSFISFLGLASKVLSLDIALVFRITFTALFFTSSFILYDFLKLNIKSALLQSGLYLSLLIPPTIMIEANTIMPQAAMLVITIPVIMLSTYAIKNRQILASLVAVILSLFALMFHELAAALLVISLLTFLINAYDFFIIKKIIPFKYLIIYIVLLIPCLRDLTGYFKQPAQVFSYTTHHVAHIGWRGWFISSYVDVGNTHLSWTGINAVLYYLNNGVFLLLALAIIIYLFVRNHLKGKLYFLPSLAYFIFFFAVAEIFPRMGIVFLPTRAWVHMMLGAACLIAMIGCELQDKIKLKNFAILLIILSVIGAGGSIYVMKNNVKKVYKEEMPVADYIKKNIPESSIIFSTQDNRALVNIYANRPKFFRIKEIDKKISKTEFDELVEKTIEECQADQAVIYSPEIIQKLITKENGRVIREEENILQPEITKKYKISCDDSNRIFFLYSYRKLVRLNNAKIDIQPMVDPLNNGNYEAFGYKIVFQDKNAVLIELPYFNNQ